MALLQYKVGERFASWFHPIWIKHSGVCYPSDTSECVHYADSHGYAFGTDYGHGWSVGNNYSTGTCIETGGFATYRSLQDNNIGNDPSTSPTWWELIYDDLGADNDHWSTVSALNRPTRNSPNGDRNIHLMWHLASVAGAYWNTPFTDGQWSMASGSGGNVQPTVRQSPTQDTHYSAMVVSGQDDGGDYITAYLYRRVAGVATQIGYYSRYVQNIPGYAGGNQTFMVYAVGDKIGVCVGSSIADPIPGWPMYQVGQVKIIEVTDATLPEASYPYVGARLVGPGATSHEWYGGGFVETESSDELTGGGTLISVGIAGFLALASATLPSFSAASVAEVYNKGTAAATLPAHTASGTGIRGHVSTVAATMPSFTGASTFRRGNNAAIASTMPAFSASAGGTVVLAGSGAAIVAVQGASASGAVGQNVYGEGYVPSVTGDAVCDHFVTGDVLATAQATLPAFVASGTDSGIWFASGAGAVQSFTGQASVNVGAVGSATANLPPQASASTGLSAIPGAGVATLPSLSGLATVAHGQPGVAAASIPSMVSSAVAEAFLPGESVGTFAATLSALESFGKLLVDPCGYMYAMLPVSTAKASGTVAVPTAVDIPILAELPRMRQLYEQPAMRFIYELPRMRQTYELKAA